MGIKRKTEVVNLPTMLHFPPADRRKSDGSLHPQLTHFQSSDEFHPWETVASAKKSDLATKPKALPFHPSNLCVDRFTPISINRRHWLLRFRLQLSEFLHLC